MKRKKLVSIIAAALYLSVVLTGCGGSSNSSGANGSAGGGSQKTEVSAPTSEIPVTLRLTTLFDTDHPVVIRAQAFADEIAEKTDAAITIKIYPNSTLYEPVAAFQ